MNFFFNNNSHVNKSFHSCQNEKTKKTFKINNYLKDMKNFSNFQKPISDFNKEEIDNSKECDLTQINHNSNLLSELIKNCQNNILTNNINDYYYNNNIESKMIGKKNNDIIKYFINSDIYKYKDYNYTFCNYSSFISTNINNYYNIISQIHNGFNSNKNNDQNNISFSLSQNLNENKINLIQYQNDILNKLKIIQNLNLINNSNGLNNINVSNINSINNINNLNYSNIFSNKEINISNLSQNSNNYNSLNNINNKNMNQNNIKENDIKPNSINYDENLIHPIEKTSVESFIKFIHSLSMPLVNFLCTPKGILDIQKKLGKSNTQCKIILIKLLNKEGLSILMKNTYGNYFFQQMIKGEEDIIIELIISYISDDFINISKDSSGTFSVQALLNEVTSIKEEQQILNIIQNHEMEMAFNKNATYVLQKIVLLFPDVHRTYLNEIILINFRDLCMDPNGICLIKNFIKTNTLINDKKRINHEIISYFVDLAQSPFGNYGIQYIMENWGNNELNDIKDKIMENIYELSIQQYSSNVVEKAFEINDEENRQKMIRKLFFEENFIILLKNKFGRFVLHKAINYMTTNSKNEFELLLLNNINNNVYKNKDKNKVKKFVMKMQNNKLYSDYSFDFNKELFVRNNMGNF